MVSKVLKLGPGVEIDNPWPLRIMAQDDDDDVPAYMVSGGPDRTSLTWIPKVTVVRWLTDAGVPARVGR